MQRQVTSDEQNDENRDPLDAPDVVWRRGKDNEKGWSFKPLIHVKPGTDLMDILRRLRDDSVWRGMR